MEWLNTHFIEPSTEEGVHLSALECPWEDETFWPYLTRYVIGLTLHPCRVLTRVFPPQDCASRIIKSIVVFPGRA